MMPFFEEIGVGDRREIGVHTFTTEEIKRFARAYDPQVFHLDEEAAAQSHFGRLCASGWHTLAVLMGLNVRSLQRRAAENAARGITMAKLGPAGGFDELKWLKPVYVGDTIAFESEVVAKRESRSRPGWGIVSLRSFGRNQSGEEVVSFIAHAFVERRSVNAEGEQR